MAEDQTDLSVSPSQANTGVGGEAGKPSVSKNDIDGLKKDFEVLKAEISQSRAEYNKEKTRSIEVIGILAALLAFGSLSVAKSEQILSQSFAEGAMYMLLLFLPFGFFAMFLHYILEGKPSSQGFRLLTVLYAAFLGISVVSFFLFK